MSYYTRPNTYFADAPMHSHKKKIFFEGDSWFSLPDTANIPVQFDSLLDLSILCLADPGDTLEELTGGWQYVQIRNLIHDTVHGQKWDALCFSAGGNDVIGPGIKDLLLDPGQASGPTAEDHLDRAAVDRTFARIRDGFLVLKRLRDESSANRDTPIFVHTYSYLTPRDLAHRFLVWAVSGPWLFPYMVEKGISDCGLQRAIVKTLLDRFHDTLASISDEPKANFHVVDLRRALRPVGCRTRNNSSEYWGDEIHPTSRGFARITRSFFIPALKDAGVI